MSGRTPLLAHQAIGLLLIVRFLCSTKNRSCASPKLEAHLKPTRCKEAVLHGPCGSRNGPDEVFGRHSRLDDGVGSFDRVDLPVLLWFMKLPPLFIDPSPLACRIE